jgi:hypothetical protein
VSEIAIDINHKAVDVMYAAYKVFAKRGDENYARSKTDTFLRRCGTDISKPKEQLLDSEKVILTANGMLDSIAEEEFFSALYKEEL